MINFINYYRSERIQHYSFSCSSSLCFPEKIHQSFHLLENFELVQLDKDACYSPVQDQVFVALVANILLVVDFAVVLLPRLLVETSVTLFKILNNIIQSLAIQNLLHQLNFPNNFSQYRNTAKEIFSTKIREDATQNTKFDLFPFFVPTMTKTYSEVGCGMKLVTLGVSHGFYGRLGIWILRLEL